MHRECSFQNLQMLLAFAIRSPAGTRHLYNVASTLMQFHNVIQRLINVNATLCKRLVTAGGFAMW